MKLIEHCQQELTKLSEQKLQRTFKQSGVDSVSFASNNYLGSRSGAGSSRLLLPQQGAYADLEKQLAEWKHTDAALVYPTGYMANVGIITALMGKGDLIIIDKLNHASIIDGCHLSGADLRVYKHKDLKSLEKILKSTEKKYKKKLIITETVFSMDGDVAPLNGIVALAKQYDCWTYVDEAHAVGVYGPQGAGVAAELGLSDQIDIQMGTLSKAVAGLGGYVAGSKLLCDYLINSSRSFIYTTALPQNLIKELIENIQWLKRSDDLREKLWNNVQYFYELAVSKGLKINKPESPIIPIMIGDEEKTLSVAAALQEKGIFLPAVRYPTVPKGQARLRCTITAEHTKEQIEYLIRNMVS
jgi:8-amino-7-oxononanoate synthase